MKVLASCSFALFVAVTGISCGEEELVGPGERAIEAAAKPGSGDPTVTGTVPNTAPRDTTLDVQVSGSGFDAGSRVDLALDGVVSEKVRTNSTRFVSKTSLVANITIAVDADPDLYDVIVTTTKGKRGIGIELFEITYEMVEIGMLSGDDGSEAVSINEMGEVVGGSGNMRPYRNRVFFWADGVMQEVGEGNGTSLSRTRRAVGYAPSSVWEEANGAWEQIVLPARPGYSADAFGISPSGTYVVGASGGAVVWKEVGGNWTITELLGCSTLARDVNDDGTVVCGDRVYLDENGSWTFHLLPPSTVGGDPVGVAINALGDVVGYGVDDSQTPHRRALLWRKTPTGWGVPESLGTLGGDSGATSINNFGVVVGSSKLTDDPLGRNAAFVWTAISGMVGLGSRFTDNYANDINDAGQIVGGNRKAAGNNRSGQPVAVMWELQ